MEIRTAINNLDQRRSISTWRYSPFGQECWALILRRKE
jgi:hypothetical protein